MVRHMTFKCFGQRNTIEKNNVMNSVDIYCNRMVFHLKYLRVRLFWKLASSINLVHPLQSVLFRLRICLHNPGLQFYLLVVVSSSYKSTVYTIPSPFARFPLLVVGVVWDFLILRALQEGQHRAVSYEDIIFALTSVPAGSQLGTKLNKEALVVRFTYML